MACHGCFEWIAAQAKRSGSQIFDRIEANTKHINDCVDRRQQLSGDFTWLFWGRYGIRRGRSEEEFNTHSGETGGTSLRTIWRSPAQWKLMKLGLLWYALQAYVYMLLANYLVYMSFHILPADNPASPSSSLLPAIFRLNPLVDAIQNERLFDVGHSMTPDLSYRPWWLKLIFVDASVMFSQMLPVLVLPLLGQTARFVHYTGCLGFISIAKGVVQLLTVLPPANGGSACWERNFKPEQLAAIKSTSFPFWIFSKGWGMTHGCNDMLWSGHTAQTCLGLLFLVQSFYRLGVSPLVRIFVGLYVVGYVWAVLACRMHYSIDLFVALLVSLLTFTSGNFKHSLWVLCNLICRTPPYECDTDVKKLKKRCKEAVDEGDYDAVGRIIAKMATLEPQDTEGTSSHNGLRKRSADRTPEGPSEPLSKRLRDRP